MGRFGGGILEKDLNLDVATVLGAILTSNGYGVFFTRTDDISLGNGARTKYCNSVGATILVSVHHNGASNPAADYSTGLYQKRFDRDLARAVSEAVPIGLGIPTIRGLRSLPPACLLGQSCARPSATATS